jgi:transposase
MARKYFTADQIVKKLREVEVLLAQGKSIQEATRQIEVSDNTYYRWKKEYGGMRTDQAKKLKSLEKENLRLKRLVADKELDLQILKEAINFESKNS